MRLSPRPHGEHSGASRRADVLMWALIAAVVLVNVILALRIATGGD